MCARRFLKTACMYVRVFSQRYLANLMFAGALTSVAVQVTLEPVKWLEV